MKEYIEREAVKNAFCASCSTNKRYHRTNEECRSHTDSYGNGCFKMRFIDSVPAADVVERKRGEWVHREYDESDDSDEYYYCSECRQIALAEFGRYTYIRSDFCPNCGADMRGEKHEAD